MSDVIVTSVGNMELVDKPQPPFYSFCCHCRQQHLDPEMKYVDLKASYDGGVQEVDSLMVTIDDVKLCYNCAVNVGKLVGMEFAEDLHGQIEELRSKNSQLNGRIGFVTKMLKEGKVDKLDPEKL